MAMEEINDVIDRFSDLFTDIVELRDEYDKEVKESLIDGDYKNEQIVKEKSDDINKLINMYKEDVDQAEKLHTD